MSKHWISMLLLIICGHIRASEFDETIEKLKELQAGYILVAGQSGRCEDLSGADGKEVSTPEGFEISPYEAMAIAAEQAGFNCGNKIGAGIWMKGHFYYIDRFSPAHGIVIDGLTGSVIAIDN